MVGRDGELCEALNLFAHDRNTSLVGGVELKDSGTVELGSEELLAEGEDGGGLAGPGRSVKEHVGQLERDWSAPEGAHEKGRAYIGAPESFLEHGDGVVLGGNLAEVLGATTTRDAVSSAQLVLPCGQLHNQAGLGRTTSRPMVGRAHRPSALGRCRGRSP